MLLANIGARIKEARKNKQLSQAELAEKLDISVSHMSAIETGTSNFGVDILARMTNTLEVSADWLLFTNNPQTVNERNAELAGLLEGCTQNQVAAILRMATEFRKTLQEIENDN